MQKQHNPVIKDRPFRVCSSLEMNQKQLSEKFLNNCMYLNQSLVKIFSHEIVVKNGGINLPPSSRMSYLDRETSNTDVSVRFVGDLAAAA